MTKDELLNRALEESGQPINPTTELRRFDDLYDLILETFLEKRLWYFSIAKETDLVETNDGVDLNYRYKYAMPSNTVDVLHINEFRTIIPFGDERTALRHGYSFSPDDLPAGTLGSDFIYIDGILHSNEEVRQVFYKRKVTPANMTATFRQALVYKIASRIAAYTRGEPQVISDLNREHKQYLREAASLNDKKIKTDQQVNSIFSFIRWYYTQTRVRS